MDIYCPQCAEPIDMDYIHDVVADRHAAGDTVATFDTVYRSFIRTGCLAIGGRHTDPPVADDDTIMDIRSIYDIIGHDADGCASMLDDVMNGLW